MKNIIALLLLSLVFGCGDISAPPDAKIEIDPPSVSLSYNTLATQGYSCRLFTISVKRNIEGKDIGLSGILVHVSGSMAAPSNPARYYFYDNTTCSGQPKASNMELVTGDFGIAYFSIWILAQIDGTENKFQDTIEVRSGVLYTSASVSVQ